MEKVGGFPLTQKKNHRKTSTEVLEGLPGIRIYGHRAATSAGVPSILIYADDYVSPGPNASVDKALQSAGLGYTAHYAGDFAGFENSLINGEWDLVIFAHQNRTLPSDSIYNHLDSYVRKGGRLIFLSFEVGTYAANPLIADLGVQYVSDHVAAVPVPVEWWFQQHRIFNAVPEFTNLKTNYVISGHFTNALPGTITLGGYTPNPTSGQGAVFSANDSRTLYLGFLDGNNEANLDGDIQKDAQEFWYNAISYVLGSPLVLLYSDNFVTPPPNTFPRCCSAATRLRLHCRTHQSECYILVADGYEELGPDCFCGRFHNSAK